MRPLEVPPRAKRAGRVRRPRFVIVMEGVDEENLVNTVGSRVEGIRREVGTELGRRESARRDMLESWYSC